MSLERKAVRGAVWTVVTSVVGRFLGVLGTLALTYFLAPDVMGEVGKASVLALTAGQLSVVGFGQYLIARTDLDRGAVWQVTWVSNTLGLVVLGGLCAIALPIAAATGDDGMLRYLPILALSVLFNRFALVPERLLVRDLRFAYVGGVRTVGEVTYAVVAVSLAWLGWGGVGVVLGTLANATIRLVLFATAVHWREWLEPHPIDRARIRDLVSFGGPLWLGGAAQFGSRNWDNLLVAALFGDATMGLYKQAYNLADIPTIQVGEAIGDVLLPSFARVDDAAKIRSLIRATGLLALIVFPLAVGLGAVAPTLVATVFNAEWQGLAPYLAILAVLSVTRPVGWIIASYLQARSQTRIIMALEIGRAVAVLGAIWALSPLGPRWAAGAVGLAFGAHALASVYAIHALDRVALGALLRPMLGPLLACAAMTGAVLGARALVPGLHPAPRLGLEIVAGALTYIGACFVVARATTTDALALLRRSFSRRARAGSAGLD